MVGTRAVDISSGFCGDPNWKSDHYRDQNKPFKPNHDVFLTFAKWFLCLNLAELKWSDVTKEKQKFEPVNKL